MKYAAKALCALLLCAVCQTQAHAWFFSRPAVKIPQDYLYFREKFPPPGKLYTVLGANMHMYCRGTGTPAVIFEAGQSEFSLWWELSAPQISSHTTVCLYDRAGLGWSQPSKRLRTAENIAEELEALLQEAKLTPPYIIVGHDMGGVYARYFAYTRPRAVAGLVLVDSSHEMQNERYGPDAAQLSPTTAQEDKQLDEAYKKILTGEIVKDTSQIYPNKFAGMDDNTQTAIRAMLANPLFWETAGDEAEEQQLSFNQLSEVKGAGLGNIKLTVISAGLFPVFGPAPLIKKAEETHRQLQKELAQLSPSGKLVVAEKSAHDIELQQPDIIVREVLAMLEALRAKPESSPMQAAPQQTTAVPAPTQPQTPPQTAEQTAPAVPSGK